MFGRRRGLDRQQLGGQPNSTGYQEKTVFTTDFGTPENNNYQNGLYTQSDYGQSVAPQNNTASSAYANNAATTLTEVAQERPMVFASRKHPDMYIYEYSDRVEWYLKTDTSMYLFDTTKKQ